ncbi:MAG TPA: hypothetical protein PLA43_19315 [Bryobacteraceae bacterium]|nr:hypothetical protein [Bryobacteraceae bacterium]HOQ47277.1 hypothetical protein [Bryobacteraceae bacterium]HPQ15339.1 hypothetical protein [Bryobacteraceae bacterium]HPU74109.1 hypothetical protein [Bryobacteraceae bacterium]
MVRTILALVLSAAALLAANFKLYLKDGDYHIVREYKVEGDRVRYYSVERSDWEEIPLTLVDLKRTEAERQGREQAIRKAAEELAAEEKFEREQAEERARVPQNPGVYLLDGKELKALKQAESKAVTSTGRSILKVLAPIPVVTGKVTVELDGERSDTVISSNRPEFYFRLSEDEQFGIVRLSKKKGARVVQKWTVIPVTNEIVEEQEDVEIFRTQVDNQLYKIWPTAPLEPGEYAVVEFTPGKRNIQIWDFSCRPN